MFIIRAIVWIIDRLYLWLVFPFRKNKQKVIQSSLEKPVEKTQWFVYWKFRQYAPFYGNGPLELEDAIKMGAILNQDKSICAWLSTKSKIEVDDPNIGWFVKENNNGQFY